MLVNDSKVKCIRKVTGHVSVSESFVSMKRFKYPEPFKLKTINSSYYGALPGLNLYGAVQCDCYF